MTSFNITAHGTTYYPAEQAPSNLFWRDPKGQLNFFTSVTGGTSGSSGSPRTELREVNELGKGLNFFAHGFHEMVGEVRVELTPSSQKVIIAQIHAHGADNPYLMVSHWNGEFRVDARETPDSATKNLIRIKCPLGQTTKFILRVLNGTLYVNAQGVEAAVGISEEWDQYPFYFKAGSYCIDHEGPADEGAWVIYPRLEVTHG